MTALVQAMFSPRALLWCGAGGMLGLATLLYLQDGRAQAFESSFPFHLLRDFAAPLADVPIPAVVNNWFADAAWAAVAALLCAEILHGSSAGRALRIALPLAGAASWELLQRFELVAGVFDPRDLLVSVASGTLVVSLHHLFVARRSAS